MSVSRSIFRLRLPIRTDITSGRKPKGPIRSVISKPDTRAIFGRSYAAEPDQLIKELAKDEAIQEADTLLLTIPNTLGVDYNVHVLSSILKHVAPGLGWR